MVYINELDANKEGVILYCDYYDESFSRKIDWDFVIDDCLATIYSKATGLDEDKCYDFLDELLEKDIYQLVDIALEYDREIMSYYEDNERKILF